MTLLVLIGVQMVLFGCTQLSGRNRQKASFDEETMMKLNVIR